MADRFLYQGYAAPPEEAAPAADTTIEWQQRPAMPRPAIRRRQQTQGDPPEGTTEAEATSPPAMYPGPTPRPRARRPFVGGLEPIEGATEAETAQPPAFFPGPTPRPRPRRQLPPADTPEGGGTVEEQHPYGDTAIPHRPAARRQQPAAWLDADELTQEWHAGAWQQPRPIARPQHSPTEPPEEAAAPPADLSLEMPFVLDVMPARRRSRPQHSHAATFDLATGAAVVGLTRPTLGYTLPDELMGYTFDVGLPEYTLPPSKAGYTLE